MKKKIIQFLKINQTVNKVFIHNISNAKFFSAQKYRLNRPICK